MVFVFVGMPLIIVAGISGFIIARNILRRGDWPSPVLTITAAILAGGVSAQLVLAVLPAAALPVGIAVVFGVTLLLHNPELASKRNYGYLIAAIVLLGCMFFAVSRLDRSSNNPPISDLGFSIWIPQQASVSNVPVELIKDNRDRYLYFKTAVGHKVFESKARKKNVTPKCGQMYPYDDYTDNTDQCSLVGVLEGGRQVYSDEGGKTYVTFEDTLVTIEPDYNDIYPGIKQDLFNYLKLFRKSNEAGARLAVEEGKKQVAYARNNPHEYITFTPLLPSKLPAGYELTAFSIGSVSDPGRPSIYQDYSANIKNTTKGASFEVGPLRTSFKPPSDCGGLWNDNDVITCKQSGTYNGWPLYLSEPLFYGREHYMYYVTNDTFAVIKIDSDVAQGEEIMRSLVPASKDEIAKAKPIFR